MCWGLGGESWCIVASFHYAKMIPQCEDHFGIVKASYNAPRSRFAQTSVGVSKKITAIPVGDFIENFLNIKFQ